MNWSASTYFRRILPLNLLARQHKFTFCMVSGLQGFEDALKSAKSTTAFLCVSDTSDGFLDLDNAPRSREVKTVFLAMRHKALDMDERQQCMDIMRELFRQLMSAFIRERSLLHQLPLYVDPRISFSEIDRYFFTGCACAYFQIAADLPTNLAYNESEWSGSPFAT